MEIGLSTLIVRKALEGAEQFDEASRVEKITGGARHLLSALGKHFLNAQPSMSSDARKVMSRFVKNQRIRIYLDDLDRGWEARKQDIANISALLNAIRDMAGEDERLQFRVGLRTDVYHLVRTSDESTDKIEANLIWLIWSNHEILTAMAKRIATYRILMTLTRKRPRALVKLFYYAAKEARKDNAEIIQSIHLQRVFEKYSNERLRDVINEFKTELPEIENLLLGMRQTNKERQAGVGPVFDDGQLNQKIKTIMQGTPLRFANGEASSPQNVARFLYKCDFVTARYEDCGYIVRKHFEKNQLISSTKAQFGFKWEIHPAYRWALAPQDIDALVGRIELSSL